jgi:spore maturation protein CgeB
LKGSNIDEALRRFKDQEYRERIADCAYQHVLSAHTYRHRVTELIGTVFGGRPDLAHRPAS